MSREPVDKIIPAATHDFVPSLRSQATNLTARRLARAPTLRGIGRGLGGFPLYPVLLALTWVLQFAAVYSLDPVSWRRSAIVAVIASLALTVVVCRLVRPTVLAGGIASFVVLALLKADSLAKVLVLVGGIGLLLVVARVNDAGRLRLPWQRLHEAVTAFCLVLFLIQAGSYVAAVTGRPAVSFGDRWSTPAPVADHPNIYIVIADGHARSDVLTADYGYDATRFVASLQDLDFDVAPQSRANYLDTELSFSSLLNGAHLADLGMDMDAPPNHAFLYGAISNNRSMAFLREIGYEIVGIGSGYDHVGERSVDRDLDGGQISHLEVRMLESSVADLWFSAAIDDLWVDATRSRVTSSLESLRQESVRAGGPKLVFVHLPVPHPPVVFDDSCDRRPSDALTDPAKIDRSTFDPDTESTRRAMAAQGDQTECVDQMLIDSLTTVVRDDPTAVVLLFSDHGPDTRFNWAAPEEPGLGDRASSLFAARTPGHRDVFPDDITLVNVVPRLFNAYFDTGLPMQPDDVYFVDARSGDALRQIDADD